ncbi:MAG: YdcF family protein [Patescibacteria group bacterium]|nr:YdcF family protein [Patescibacteria group bacterium]
MPKKFDAILVPGGGISQNKTLPKWTVERLNKAIKLFGGQSLIITLSAGTIHHAFLLDSRGFPIYESKLAAKYLLEKKVIAKNILTETASLDTIGNAYFARVIHADPKRLKKLAIVTSKFHMPRTKKIFKWIFSLTPKMTDYQLSFFETPNTGLSLDQLSARQKREAGSLKKLIPLTKSIITMADFHDWLFSQHAAYATGLKPQKISKKLLQTY